MAFDTRRGINISIASLGAMIPVALAAWFLLKPTIVRAVGDDLQEQVVQAVSEQVKPINRALSIIIQNNINDLKSRISRLEYQRDFPPPNDWTSRDAADLTGLHTQLSAQQSALDALKPSRTS